MKRKIGVKSALAGGVIGLIVGILPWFESITKQSWLIYLWSPLSLITSRVFQLSGEENLIVIFLAPLLYLIIGIIIGQIVYIVKYKKK